MMSSTIVRSAGLAAGVAALILSVACGGEDAAEPEASPTPTQAKPPPPHIPTALTVEAKDAEGNPVRFSGKDPQGTSFWASIGDDATVPDTFPDDVPMFPDATPMAAMDAGAEGTMVTLKSIEDQEEIYDFYQTQLAEEGWNIESAKAFGGQRSLAASKDKRKVTVSISGTRGDSRISVIVTGVN